MLDDVVALPTADRERVRAKIESLADDPRPSGSEALAGRWHGHLRVRVGNYRIIYTVRDMQLVIVVVRVAHRREVYR